MNAHAYRSQVLFAVFIIFLFPQSLPASEVILQNDDGLVGVSRPNFNMGESAAAWLTSPCTGDLVAVQVYWASVIGVASDSQEDSITVFSSGTFPDPGSVLMNTGAVPAIVASPIMSEGVLHEYRFLDPAPIGSDGTSLSVPVTGGQTFVVSFKFLNTNNGNPSFGSVVEDSDGCQVGLNTVEAIPGGWVDACLAGVTGDWLIRAVVDCVPPPIPTVSEWGLVVFVLAVLVSGSMVFRYPFSSAT